MANEGESAGKGRAIVGACGGVSRGLVPACHLWDISAKEESLCAALSKGATLATKKEDFR